ncbi:transposase [Paenibacillus sp. GP183]|uniref:transposase n=1 Tax=Paenibacillus sp. GP183 TaxID=1882751 RepID=UPI000AF743B4|nr:transposase [Paenibacillus sp. GP183]
MNIIMDNLLFGVGYFFMKKKGKCRELSKTHIAQATNFRGIVLAKRHLTFKNAMEGYEKLQHWMDELQQKHRLKTVIIGMEPTGHYWWNLANWLEQRP